MIRQTQADATTFEFAYTLDANGKVTQGDVTDPEGHVTRTTFNASGYPLATTEAVGTPLQRTTTLTRNSPSNLVAGVTDPLNRQTDYAYDSSGNLTSVTRLAGTPDAVTTTWTYEPLFHQVASVTDPLNHTTTFAYDSLGRMTTVTDPLNHERTFTYNAAGQVLTASNDLNESVQFGYARGDLVSITTPLGSSTVRHVDAAGRLLSSTDALGRRTQFEYNALNQLTSITDALGGQTGFTYDPNGNLLTLTDARNKTTTWTYDVMDRVATRTDPLSRQESFTYTGNGHLSTWTDRKNQLTTYTYDELDRQTFVGFGTTGSPPAYASTITTTYDAGDRPTQFADSGAGTITRAYDVFDRLTSETTPEGTVSYTYDDDDRRATMTASGQSAVSYAYDTAHRLTGITQGSATVGFAYDAADRRTSLTLPNGLVTEYSYDLDSQVTGFAYKQGATTIGSLTYAYDPAGQRSSVGGTWARTNLPAALASATYDDANQIATFGGVAFAYDANGNLTSDGVHSYTWDARNQLASLTGSVNGSFTYDAVGRRRSKTIGGTTTQFLYDGLNPVQELSGGSPVANLLTGFGVDEYFARTDGAGVGEFLTDALGSSVALADGSGTIQTEYSYDPFGTPTTSGGTSGNTFAFTGREADGTGLYFYRARYYDPRLQRFIGEDPIGFLGGDQNLYAYVLNSPTNWVDPTGLCIPVGPVAVSCIPPAVAALAEAAVWVGGTAVAVEIGQWIGDRLSEQYAKHNKGKRQSTQEKHEKGDERRKRDKGGEKADWPDGPRRPPRKSAAGLEGRVAAKAEPVKQCDTPHAPSDQRA